jgi:hypothetical protein
MSTVATRFARHGTRPGGATFERPNLSPAMLSQLRLDPSQPGANPGAPAVSGGGPAAADPALAEAVSRALADEGAVTEPAPPAEAPPGWSDRLRHPVALGAAALLAAGGTYLALNALFPAKRGGKKSAKKGGAT